MSKIQPVRGTHDIIGDDVILYKHIEKVITFLANDYDFNEIITPIFESSELFKKPLGENSDIVTKEMYSFEDRNKSILTLRPEYTTPMIRACITNNFLNQLPVKLFGLGPMFRRERPQKGRYRQFYQINFEILGTQDPFADTEIICLAYDFLKKLKLDKKIKLCINSLGDLNTISKYKNTLSDYYNKFKNDLSDESKFKIYSNPLRILDSKNSKDIEINQNTPKIDEFYSNTAKKIFDEVQYLISKFNIPYKVDKNLVRGLDYYCHTVFEYKIEQTGSQNTILGGGRYDGLVKALGGSDVPGVGWACGIERLMMLLTKVKQKPPNAQLILLDHSSKEYGLKLLINLRNLNFKIRFDYKYNLKKSLKHANESKIKYVIIIGESEVKNNNYTIKNLFKGSQNKVSFEKLVNILNL